MAVDVVDALEVVDVEHEERDHVVRAAGLRQRLPESLVEGPVVEEAGERVGLGLMLEACANLRVVERERGGVPEALCQLELVVVERRIVTEPVDVQSAFDRVTRNERDRDQRLRLVLGRAGDR